MKPDALLDFLLLSTPDLRDRLLDNIEWTSGSGEMVLEDLGIDDQSISLDSEEVRDATRRWAREAVAGAGATVAGQFEMQGYTVEAWRVITAPRNWKPDGTDFGIYWAWQKDSAGAHDGRFKRGWRNWLLRARVELEQVDWDETILANAHPSFDHECEIRLKLDARVELLDAWDAGPARAPTQS